MHAIALEELHASGSLLTTLSFVTESEPSLRKLIKQRFRRGHDRNLKVIKCITRRDAALGSENAVGLYIASPPCQHLSAIGEGKSEQDARSTPMHHVTSYVVEKKPTCFVIEEVTGLKERHPDVYKRIIKKLRHKNRYKVKTWTLCPRQFGIPCSRKRVYITGVRKSYKRHPLKAPKVLCDDDKPPVSIVPFLGVTTHPPSEYFTLPQNPTVTSIADRIRKLLEKRHVHDLKPYVFDFYSNFTVVQVDACPCVTRVSAASRRYVLQNQVGSLSYRLDVGDFEKLQGASQRV
jgi:site-specific DNA-cytosine methylase